MTPAWKMGLPDDWRVVLDRECCNVTICIAACCNYSREGGKKIILCTDWQVSSYLGSAETKHKQEWIGKGFHCLIAGDPREADSVIAIMKQNFQGAGVVDETNIRPLVEKSFYARLKERRDALAQARFSMSHAEILQYGKDRLPSGHFVKYLDDAAKIGLDIELIVAGFAAGDNVIVEIDRNTVSMPDVFSCIGEGAFLARASLLRRELTDVVEFGRALYEVYEAKRAAERVNSVGKRTLISVVEEDGNRKSFILNKMDYLEAQYAQYGPKETPLTLPLPDGLFQG
jgi:hypothetical protein